MHIVKNGIYRPNFWQIFWKYIKDFTFYNYGHSSCKTKDYYQCYQLSGLRLNLG